MNRLPTLKPREVIAIRGSLGFEEVRQRGFHKQVRYPDGRQTTVPVHRGRDVTPILLLRIIKDTGFTPEEFLEQR